MGDPRNSLWYYVDADPSDPADPVKQRGPVTLVELRGLWRSRAIDRETFAWCDGMDDFKQVSHLPELAAALKVPLPADAANSARAGASVAGRGGDGEFDRSKMWKTKDANGDVVGPVAFDALKTWWDYEQIDEGTEVWTSGMRAYAPVRDVPALFKALALGGIGAAIGSRVRVRVDDGTGRDEEASGGVGVDARYHREKNDDVLAAMAELLNDGRRVGAGGAPAAFVAAEPYPAAAAPATATSLRTRAAEPQSPADALAAIMRRHRVDATPTRRPAFATPASTRAASVGMEDPAAKTRLSFPAPPPPPPPPPTTTTTATATGAGAFVDPDGGSMLRKIADMCGALKDEMASLENEYASRRATLHEEHANAHAALEAQARSIHWSPYDPVGVVNADP
jgi:hypothetical protein